MCGLYGLSVETSIAEESGPVKVAAVLSGRLSVCQCIDFKDIDKNSEMKARHPRTLLQYELSEGKPSMHCARALGTCGVACVYITCNSSQTRQRPPYARLLITSCARVKASRRT